MIKSLTQAVGLFGFWYLAFSTLPPST
jgi:hypothetical protein